MLFTSACQIRFTLFACTLLCLQHVIEEDEEAEEEDGEGDEVDEEDIDEDGLDEEEAEEEVDVSLISNFRIH